jgi:hypothetical protein
MAWVLARCQAQHERRLVAFLADQAQPIEAYTPLRERVIRRRYTKKRYTIMYPAFATYVFVNLPNVLYDLRKLYECRVSSWPVWYGDEIAVVQDETIALVKTMEAEGLFNDESDNRTMRVKVGDKVSVPRLDLVGMVSEVIIPGQRFKVVFNNSWARLGIDEITLVE